MPKEKKIGIRFYLNKRLNPNVVNGENRYPVYAQITFDRKTFQCYFPLTYSDGYLSESEFEKYVEKRKHSEINKQLDNFEDKVKTIIRAEFDFFGSKFSFKKFSDRLFDYEEPVTKFVERYAKKHLIEALSPTLSTEETKALNNELFSFWDLYSVVEKSYPDQLEELLKSELRVKFLAYVYLAGYVGKEYVDDYNPFFPTPTALDWLKSDVANDFKRFLLQHSPIESKEQKKDLGFFMTESLDSPVRRLFFSLDLSPIDISLIISEINKSIFE